MNNEIEELKEMLQQALPALKKFGEVLPDIEELVSFNKERKQREKDEADGRTAAVKEIEQWQKDYEARQKSDELYAAELSKRIYDGKNF